MNINSNTYKVINRYVGKAIHRYKMIEDGDRILVGLSGGIDSLTLMWILKERLRRVPIRYELLAVHIDPGFEGGYMDTLTAYCENNGYRFRAERTDYGVVAHSAVNRENPCFLCSRLRRKRIFEIADEKGCNKVAMGHHKDDVIETLFLNICYAGEISTMLPSQPLFKGHLQVIRPLAYVDKAIIQSFAEQMSFPRFINPCPSAQNSKRRELKTLLDHLYRTNRKIKGNIFHALHNVKLQYLLQNDTIDGDIVTNDFESPDASKRKYH